MEGYASVSAVMKRSSMHFQSPWVFLVMTLMVVCISECVNNTQHYDPILDTKASSLCGEVVPEKLAT